jgi:hypothetical protein
MLQVAKEPTMEQQHATPSFWKSPFGIIATLLAIGASAYLYTAHKDHVIALLPFAFLAACPLMHLFMHRGHGHGGHSQHSGQDGTSDSGRR